MRTVIFSLSLAMALLAADANAQNRSRLGEIGFTVLGRAGLFGSPCSGADCIARPATVLRGETVQVRVQAPLGTPFAIGFAPSISRCVQLPNVANMLVLGDPVWTLTVGRSNVPDFGCYFAMGVHRLAIPSRLPPGLQFGLQSWAYVPTPRGLMPTWSVGILATVQ